MINACTNPVANLCARMMLDLHDISPDADIAVWDAMSPRPQSNSKLNLCVDIQHVSNDKIAGWHRVTDNNSYVIVECKDLTRTRDNILFYDFMWNRSKAYYTQRRWNYRPWHWHDADDFLLQDISTAEEKTKLFVSPNKPTTKFRQQLAELTNKHNGYTNALAPNSINPEAQQAMDLTVSGPIQGYRPVHNAYYRQTFFSVYTESVDSGSTLVATEKTLDPLIKGHFILPFGAYGFVKYLSISGWRLPTFINYSYDFIHDDQRRFDAFSQEFKRLCAIDMDTWCQLWLDNIDIIQYNRNQLYNRPYHRLSILDEM